MTFINAAASAAATSTTTTTTTTTLDFLTGQFFCSFQKPALAIAFCQNGKLIFD